MDTALDFDFFASPTDAPARKREIIAVPFGHRMICAEMELGASGVVDLAIEGAAGLTLAAARAAVISTIERDVESLTAGRCFARGVAKGLRSGDFCWRLA
jgi:hypothetical protein